ncbi:hypothetical protein GN956_G18299 [Arapaima gigas]
METCGQQKSLLTKQEHSEQTGMQVADKPRLHRGEFPVPLSIIQLTVGPQRSSKVHVDGTAPVRVLDVASFILWGPRQQSRSPHTREQPTALEN